MNGFCARCRGGIGAAAVLAALVVGCGNKGGAGDSQGGASTAAGGSGQFAGLNQGPRAYDTGTGDPARAAQGEKLFQTKGCSACHAFGRRVTGPDLVGVTHRRTAAWIQGQILHPAEMVKHDSTSHALFGVYALQMPNQGLTPDEAKSMLEFFLARDHGRQQ